MSQYFLSKVNYGLCAKYLDWARVPRHICESLWVSFSWVLMRDAAWGPSFCMTQTQRSINYELAERAGERGARTEPEWYSVELAKRWKQKQSRQTEGRGAARRKKCEVTSSCVWVDVSERQSGSERKVALGQEGFTLFFKHIELFVGEKIQLTRFLSWWSFCRRCQALPTIIALFWFNSKKHLVRHPVPNCNVWFLSIPRYAFLNLN